MKAKDKRNNLKEFLFPLWYSLISNLDKNAEVRFMNYGYSSPDLEIDLDDKHRENRYPIQLYHQIAAKVEMRGKDICEVGCGRGGGLAYLMERFNPGSAVGVDLNPVAVKFCNSHYNLPGLSFIRANAENLPFEDNSMDIIINVESSHRYANMPGFLGEVRRVLRPGGKFLLTDFRHKHRMAHLKESIAESGLAQLIEEFITHKVVRALEDDDRRRRILVKRVMPWFLHKTAYNFAAVRGTPTYNSFVDQRMLYFNYVMEKNQNAV